MGVHDAFEIFQLTWLLRGKMLILFVDRIAIILTIIRVPKDVDIESLYG
jgi:hypothetical protein